jgi:hypothetical protein
MYIAQQISHYPPEYIRSSPTPERLLETIERFEEDLTDHCRVHRQMSASIQVGEAIEVSPKRARGASDDPVMSSLNWQLHQMLGIDLPTIDTEEGSGKTDVHDGQKEDGVHVGS